MAHCDDVTKVMVIFSGLVSTSYSVCNFSARTCGPKTELVGKTVNLWLREGLFDVHQYVL